MTRLADLAFIAAMGAVLVAAMLFSAPLTQGLAAVGLAVYVIALLRRPPI